MSTAPIRVVIRTDASAQIGAGHTFRCLALAQALTQVLTRRGVEVRFVCRELPGHFIEEIRARGHEVSVLPAPRAPLTPASDEDYAAWLGVPWTQDVEETTTQSAPADWLIVDHYGIGSDWEAAAQTRWGTSHILAIDDLQRRHDCDLLLDQTLDLDAASYRPLVPAHCRILAGIEYALLDARFAELRTSITAPDPDRLLVSMGAIDTRNTTLGILSTLDRMAHPPQVTVLLGTRSPHHAGVAAFTAERDWIDHLAFARDFADLMAAHGTAIGAPGSTAWQRACLGIPSIMIPIAANQTRACAALAARGAGLVIEPPRISTELLPALAELRGNHDAWRRRCMEICDGRGAERVAAVMARD